MAGKKAEPEVETLKVYTGDLTVADVIDIEDFVGQAWGAFASQRPLPLRVAAALEFVTRRRTNPEFRLADALSAKARDLHIEVVDGDPPQADAAS